MQSVMPQYICRFHAESAPLFKTAISPAMAPMDDAPGVHRRLGSTHESDDHHRYLFECEARLLVTFPRDVTLSRDAEPVTR